MVSGVKERTCSGQGDSFASYACCLYSFHDDFARTEVGNKFGNLAVVSDECDVPPAICVGSAAFELALGERASNLAALLQDLESTRGSFLDAAVRDAQRIFEGFSLPAVLEAELYSLLERTLPATGSFAVRSSAADEDSVESSLAGIYSSRLDVSLDALPDAIVAIWRDYFSYAALANRARRGLYSPAINLGVIVQAMVQAHNSGVVLTHGHSPQAAVVEYVRGRGDALVAGLVTPSRSRPTEDEPPFVRSAVAAALRLRHRFRRDVEVEWAWDGHLRIVQVRPVVRRRHDRRADAPFMELDPLFAAAGGGEPDSLKLGACEPIYRHYVRKRRWAHGLAVDHGIATPASRLLSFNREGLTMGAQSLAAILDGDLSSRKIIDVSPTLRQVIVEKSEVYTFLLALLASRSSFERQTVIIRDFIQGDVGFISRVGETHELLLELSEEGLLGLNRGTAAGRRIMIPDVSDRNVVRLALGEHSHVPADIIPDIYALTRLIDNRISGAQAEWAVHNGAVVFMNDFSHEPPNRTIGLLGSKSQLAIVSRGTVEGRLLVLTPDDELLLERLSISPTVSVSRPGGIPDDATLTALVKRLEALPEKPVVYSERPYAILAAVFAHVSGFVFRDGGILSHLGILLREENIPAIIAPNFRPVHDERIIIDDDRLLSIRAE